MTEIHKSLIEQFRAERKKQGVSQERVSQIGDVSLSMVTKVETFRKKPTLDIFMEMCKGIGYMMVIAPIPKQVENIVITEKVEVEVFKEVDYDNWKETI